MDFVCKNLALAGHESDAKKSQATRQVFTASGEAAAGVVPGSVEEGRREMRLEIGDSPPLL